MLRKKKKPLEDPWQDQEMRYAGGLDDPGAPIGPAYEGVGAHLKYHRERLGQSLEQTCSRLRIRRAHLDAIEEGRFEDLPGRIYAIGFIRTYAEYLELDGQAIVERFKQETGGGSDVPKLVFPTPNPESRTPKGWLITMSLLIAGGLYGVWYYVEQDDGATLARIADLPQSILEPAPAPQDRAAAPPPASTSPNLPPAQAETVSPAPSSALTPAPAPKEVPNTAADPPAPRDNANNAGPAVAEQAAPETHNGQDRAQDQAVAQAQPDAASEDRDDAIIRNVARLTVPPSQPAESSRVVSPDSVLASPTAANPDPAADRTDKPVLAEPDRDPATPTPAAQTDPEPSPAPSVSERAPAVTAPTPEPATSPASPRPAAAVAAQAEPTPSVETNPQAAKPKPPAVTAPPSPATPTPTTTDVSEATPATAAPSRPEAPRVAALPPPVLSRPPSLSPPRSAAGPEPQTFGNASDGGRVVVRATMDSWVQIRDADDKLLLTRILRAGDSYVVPDSRGAVMMTGNAGGLSIEVDGKPVAPIGPVGEVRRNVSLKAEALLTR